MIENVLYAGSWTNESIFWLFSQPSAPLIPLSQTSPTLPADVLSVPAILSGPISSWWTRIKNKIATGAIGLATTLGTVGAEELLKQGIDTFFQN
jgi:hypothetical protein